MTAISKAWVTQNDAAVDADSPIDQALMEGLRDDLVHLREWLGASYYAGAVQDHNHDGINSALTAPAYMLVRDEKSVGTIGGASSATTHHTRTLNTVLRNTITGASLGSNQITLPAGTYRVRASAPAYAANWHKAYLYNVTAGSLALAGTSEYQAVSVQTRSLLDDRITVASSTVFELRHYIDTAASEGLGVRTNVSAAGIEVYSIVEIIKEG